jgi:F-type H+-transporting ATPase subunit delta
MATSPKIVRKYATAIFFVAKESKSLDNVSKDLELILSIFQEFTKEVVMINDVVYSNEMRCNFVDKIQKKHKFHSVTVKFLKVLSVKKRLDIINDIVKEFQELCYKMDNVEKVQIVSIKKLPKSEIDSIEKFFSKNMKKKIWVDNVVDQTIIGGTMIKIGSMIFDDSIANKMHKMKLFVENITLSEQ